MKILETFLQAISEDREAFKLLPVQDKIKQNRERRLATLINAGYLSPDEVDGYRELTELPTDRKSLAVAYYLLGLDNSLDLPPTIEETKRKKSIISSFNLSQRMKEEESVKEALTAEEAESLAKELTHVRVEGYIGRAETFVTAKRSRIRGLLLKLFPLAIASSLVEESQERNNIPYLKTFLQERGYRANAKNLIEADIKALREAGEYYLNLIELSLLNGTGLLRYEEYKEYLNDDKTQWIKDFFYRDIIDEALTEFETIYTLFDNAVGVFYGEETNKEALNFLNAMREELIEEYKPALAGTKFNVLFDEVK